MSITCTEFTKPITHKPFKANTGQLSEELKKEAFLEYVGSMSNKEKKEVLHELDQTLMDLLDVVDKVQTVDESRLGEESEVQP